MIILHRNRRGKEGKESDPCVRVTSGQGLAGDSHDGLRVGRAPHSIRLDDSVRTRSLGSRRAASLPSRPLPGTHSRTRPAALVVRWFKLCKTNIKEGGEDKDRVRDAEASEEGSF